MSEEEKKVKYRWVDELKNYCEMERVGKKWVVKQPYEYFGEGEEGDGEYYTGENLARLKRSVKQSEEGKVIMFTVEELMAMEDGGIPQRALDFLEKHKEVSGKELTRRTREAVLARGKEALREAQEQAVISETSEMTLDEINEMISECRKESMGA